MKFDKSYLFIPMGGSRSSRLQQVLSIVCSFVFIALWHGYSYRIALWTLFNCGMILTEIVYSNLVLQQIYVTKIVNFMHFKLKTVLNNYQLNKKINRMNESVKLYSICFLLSIWQMGMHCVSFLLLSDLEPTIALFEASVFSSI